MVSGKVPSLRTKTDLTLLKTFDVGDLMIRHGRIPAEFVDAVIPAGTGIQLTEGDSRFHGNDLQSVTLADLSGDTSSAFLDAITPKRSWLSPLMKIFQPFKNIADTFALGTTTNLFIGGVGGGGDGGERYEIDYTDQIIVLAELTDMWDQRLEEPTIMKRFANRERAQLIRSSSSMPEVVERLERFVNPSDRGLEGLMRDRALLYVGLMKIYSRAAKGKLFENERNWMFWGNRVKAQIDFVENRILRLQLGDDTSILLRADRGKLGAIRKTPQAEGLQTWLTETEEHYKDADEDVVFSDPELFDAMIHLEYLEAIENRLYESAKATADLTFTMDEIVFGARLTIEKSRLARMVRKGRTTFIQKIFE